MSIPDPNTIGEFYNTNVIANPQVAEYGKFIQFPNDDSQFPAVSVTRVTHPDTSEAFPGNTGATGLTSIDVYPKFGIISYIANSEAFSVTLSAQQVSLNTVPLQQALSALTTINLINSNTLGTLTAIDLATELNTFDTLTAVAAFNNNFVTALPALTSVNVTNTLSATILNPQIEITNDIGNPIPTTATNTITATSDPVKGFCISYGDTGQMDAFGRLKVSTPTTLLDSKSIYQKNLFVFDEITNGTGASTLSTFDSCVDLTTSANNDYVIRQTRTRYNYQPGKSMQYIFSGLAAPQANIVKRIGAFQSLSAAPYTPSDGIYLEITTNPGGPTFNIIKNQGTPYTLSVSQSAWNVDKLDGTGPSGINLNFNSAIIFSIDYEWLGSGRVRFGFYKNGKFNIAHVDTHTGSNLLSPYMSYSNQPVRYEIRQTGSGSGILRHFCSTVLVDGGTEDVGKIFSVEDGVTTVQNGIFTPILALQLNPQTPNVLHIIKQIDVLNTGDHTIAYSLFKNPTITGGTLSFSPVATNTSMLSAAGNGSLTITEGISGWRIHSGYLQSGGAGPNGLDQATSENTYSNEARFGCGVKGDSDIIVLAAKGIGGTSTVYGTLTVLEKS